MSKLGWPRLAKFPDLESKIEREFNKTLTETFFTKLRFVKGPELELIPSIISKQLSHLNKDLISFVDSIWIGLKDITILELQEINERKNRHIDFKTITETRIKEEILHKNEDINLHTYHQFESGYGNKVTEQIFDVDEEEIRYLINKYKHDSQFRYNVLKRLDELSRTRILYQSISFLKFLKISKNEDKNEVLMFLYILHNLFLVSKEYDKQTYSSLVANYKPLLSSAFIEFRGRYSILKLETSWRV